MTIGVKDQLLDQKIYNKRATYFDTTCLFLDEENGQMPLSKKTIQYFAPFPKLIREMCLFWNLIFSKLGYKNNKKNYGAL